MEVWDKTELDRVYGPWRGNTPQDAAALFDGYPGTWWIAGGWALEAFTGVRREHEDIDPSALFCELPLLRRHLAGVLDLWCAYAGALKPLPPGEDPEGPAHAVLPEGCGQLWTRRSGVDPWEYDVLLAPGTRDEWVYKRDPSVRMPMPDALWERDGVRYLQPELTLLYKAKGLRPKDRADFDATLPFLDERRRAWLRENLARTHPGHSWLGRL